MSEEPDESLGTTNDTFQEEIRRLRSSHELAASDQPIAREELEAITILKARLREALAKARSDNPDVQYKIEKFTDSINKALESTLNGIENDALGDVDAIAEVDREAQEHLGTNDEKYIESAIQDANDAGIEITYNGESHPPNQQ